MASGRTDWSETLGLKISALQRQINSVPDSLEVAKGLSQEGQLLARWGSRSLAWRIFLGLLPTVTTSVQGNGSAGSDTTTPNEVTKVQWVKRTREIRQKWADLEKSISLKVIAQTTKNFNPLAPQKADESLQADKEMKALIW